MTHDACSQVVTYFRLRVVLLLVGPLLGNNLGYMAASQGDLLHASTTPVDRGPFHTPRVKQFIPHPPTHPKPCHAQSPATAENGITTAVVSSADPYLPCPLIPLSLPHPHPLSPAGTPWGQAAVFNQYELEDGTIVTVQGEQVGPSSIEVPPSKEDVAAAEAAVQEQAAAVRALKEGQGLTNADSKVQDAVAELQQLKAVLAELQEKYQAAVREAEAEAAAPPTVEDTTEE